MSSRVRGALIALGLLMVLVGSVYGFISVGGSYEGESFTCGSPFNYDNSEGYRGSSDFDDCNSTREGRLPLTLGIIGLGAASLSFLAVATLTANRRRSGWMGPSAGVATAALVIGGGLALPIGSADASSNGASTGARATLSTQVQESRCTPATYDASGWAQGSHGEWDALRHWYNAHGRTVGAPRSGWRLDRLDGFPDRMVNGDWRLVLLGSDGMESWRVSAVQCRR
jgi:hypothetical protein